MAQGNDTESIAESDNENEIKNHLKDGILKLLAATSKSVELDEGALTECSRLIYLLLEELVTVCAPLTTKDVEDYIARAYPVEIYEQCKLKGEVAHSKSSRKRGTIRRAMADGVKLKFNVEIIYPLSRKEWYPRGLHVKYDLIVYILAMLEHIASLILNHAGALAERLSNNSKPVISPKHINIARNYKEGLRKLFDLEERRGNVAKPALKTEHAQSYEEAVRRFMADQSNYIKDLQIIVNKIMPIFAKPESGLKEDMVDFLFGNVKDILLFEVIFQNDLEEAKEMIRQDSSFHVGVVFVEKALAEDYDVYAYYANNYKQAHKQLLKLLENPEFLAYLEVEAEGLGFTKPYLIDGIIGRLVITLLQEPLYHLVHIFETAEVLLKFMTKLSVTSKEDRSNEVEYLKQTISHFARISDILEQVEQDFLTNTRDNAPHLTPRKAGLLRAYNAWEKIENIGEPYQAFSQICSEHILNGNLFVVSEKGEQKLKHCYLFDGMLLICARLQDAKANRTGLRTIFKEKHLLRDLTFIKDWGRDSSHFDLFFRDVEIKLQAKNGRDKDEWVHALLVVCARKVLYSTVEKAEQAEIDYYSILDSSYRFTEPDTEHNVRFVENKSKGYTSIPTIAQGTILKLVERVTYHKYTDLALVKQFLTTFRFFVKRRELLDLLIDRYNIQIPDTLLNPGDDIDKIEMLKRLQKEYIKPVQLRVINVMRHWIDYHFDDFEKETELVSIMLGFFDNCKKKQKTMKKWIAPLERTIQRKQEHQQRRRGESMVGTTDPPVWHVTRNPEEYSLFTLHPQEIARQATLIENEFYRSVTPQELLGSHEEKQGGNMAQMINFSERFVFWIRQSIVATQNLEERIYIATRVFELMEHLRAMNNFTGVFEVNSALKSAEVYRLEHTIHKLFKDKEELLKEVGDWPAMNFKSYKERLKSCDPPCIPFIGIYKTKIMHTQDGNKDFKHDMINLSKFRMIADIISEIKLYQNERYIFVPEKSIQDFLRNLDPFKGRTSDELQTDLYNLSLEIEPKGMPPKQAARSSKINLSNPPHKVKRSGSLILGGRAGKSDTVKRHRDSSVSDASEGSLRTPGSKSTVSPGSTRSPKEFFGYKFSTSGRSVTSDHDSPECSPLLAPSSEASDPEPSPRPFTRTESEESPKPPIPARDQPKPPPREPVPPRDLTIPPRDLTLQSRDATLQSRDNTLVPRDSTSRENQAPAPPARPMGRSKSAHSLRDKPSPVTSPCFVDEGEYLETILNKPLSPHTGKAPLATPKPPATPPKSATLPPKSPSYNTGSTAKAAPPMPKRSVSTLGSSITLSSITEARREDSSGTSGESLSDIHAASRFIILDDRALPPPGMVRQSSNPRPASRTKPSPPAPRTSPVQPGPRPLGTSTSRQSPTGLTRPPPSGPRTPPIPAGSSSSGNTTSSSGGRSIQSPTGPPMPGGSRQSPTGPPAPASRAHSNNKSCSTYSTPMKDGQVRTKKRPPPLSVPRPAVSPTNPPPIPLKTRSISDCHRKPPPLPPKTGGKVSVAPPTPPPPLPPRRTSR